ncbi:MAG: addiction module protein [Dehalococcoidia bacterium]
MTKVEELYERSLELSDREAEELLQMLEARLRPEELSETWKRIIRERQRALRAGTSTTVPWSEVRERMFKRARGI